MSKHFIYIKTLCRCTLSELEKLLLKEKELLKELYDSVLDKSTYLLIDIRKHDKYRRY